MKYCKAFFLTPIFASAASYATWNSPVLYTPETGESYHNQELHLHGGQHIDNLQLSGSSMLTVNSGSLLRNAKINDTSCVQLYNTVPELFSSSGIKDAHFADKSTLVMESGSFSTGNLFIDSASRLYITHVDDNSAEPFADYPPVSGNVSLENLTLAGKVVIAPTSTLENILDDDDHAYQHAAQQPGPSVITRIANLSMQPGSSISLEPYLPHMQFNQLKIKSLSGSGNFILSTHLASGFADRIEIDQATGHFGLLVNDSGYEPDTPQRTGLVSVKRGNADFRLLNPGGVVEAGIWQYRLAHEQKETHSEWVLVNSASPELSSEELSAQKSTAVAAGASLSPSQAAEVTATQTAAARALSSTPERTMSRSAQAAINMAGVSRYMMSGEMSPLRQRLGDTRQSDGEISLWTRYLSDDQRQQSEYGPSRQTSLRGLQIGLDRRLDHNNGHWLSGLYFSDSQARVSSEDRANGQSRSQSGTAYTTWLGSSGLYWDNQLKLSTFRHQLHTAMNSGNITTGHYRQRGLALASETGYTLALSATTALTPYGKVSYFRTGRARYTLDNGMASVLPQASSIEAEAGLLLQTSVSLRNKPLSPYFKAAVSGERRNRNRITINSSDFKLPSAGTRGLYGAGATLHMAQNVAAWAEIEQQSGKKSRTPVKGHLGIRLGF